MINLFLEIWTFKSKVKMSCEARLTGVPPSVPFLLSFFDFFLFFFKKYYLSAFNKKILYVIG